MSSVRNKQFSKWFDDLTPEEFNKVWDVKKYRDAIKDRVRQPKKLHEWCMVCETPKFKKWGVSMREIKRFRTKTAELKWKVPNDVPTVSIRGKCGGHGGSGSGTFHNELQIIIYEAKSLKEFNDGINRLIVRWEIDPNLLPPLIK